MYQSDIDTSSHRLLQFSASNAGRSTKANLEVTSIYFSDEIALSEELDLIIGGRLDDFELIVHSFIHQHTILHQQLLVKKMKSFHHAWTCL
ncbi:MAG: hypothetical protein ACJZ9L_05260 [Coraliomargaritaceae bacterium]